MRRRKFKVMLTIFALILVLGNTSTPITAIENIPASKPLTVESRALGDTIAQTFPDENMAQAVADRIADGDVNTVIDTDLVNSTSYLGLINKNISNIEGISVFSNLTKLYLDNNQITEIPVEIGNLSNLENLRLDYNQITALPAELGNLSNLIHLFLRNNQITEIPVEIGNLSSLEVLMLGNNQITEIPTEIGNLSNLEWIWLDDNQIIDLPQDMFDFIISRHRDHFNLDTQNYTENLSTLGTVGTDYEFDGLPAYEQFPNYGMTFTYSLTLPNGTTTSINPSIADGKVTILDSDLSQVGDYTLVANGTRGVLAPVTFTTNFSVGDDAPAMYTVVFDPDNGTSFNEWESVDVAEGELIPNTATIPQKEGYTFIGWASTFDVEGNPILWNFETDVMPSHNMILWATYEKEVDNIDNNGNENNNNNNNENNNDNDESNKDEKDLNKLPQSGNSSGIFAMMMLLASALLTSGYLLTKKREQ